VSYFEDGRADLRPVFEDTMPLQRVAWILSFLLLFAISGETQAGGPRQQVPVTDVTADEAQRQLAHDMEKKANSARQASIKADTDKLLKLATELKESVEKSNENVLSLDVVKKADEIERLAHSVKDKMKGPS
jgi:nitric oxide reductase activation protein